ncbi:MAG: protein kinase [Desulfobacteraceae bacterium]|nr:protein kinase [Desulfobacteraceae bacterium]
MAHLDTAPNGSIRGVFGYLLSVEQTVQDRYLIHSVLGKGGFGATYLVEDLKLKGKRRALKEIPELLFDEHEANLLSQLNHPTIPDIIDRFVNSGMVYLILEFGGRHTLGTECKRFGGRMPLGRSVSIMRQLCDALAYLHAQDPPIIHRDLKPDNVLLDDNDRIMLIDFGIAKESTDGTTRMMAKAASHGFSPPEQVMGTGTDERSDIYSFGATFYYMITGQIPAAAHERVAGKELAPPSSLVPNLPPEFDETILSTLSLNINQRPAKIDDLKYMLDALSGLTVPEMPHTSQTVRIGPTSGGFASSQPGTSGTGMTGIKIPTSGPILSKTGGQAVQQKKDIKPYMAIAVALLAGLAIGAYFLFGGKTEKQPAQPAPTAVQPPSQPAPQAPPVQTQNLPQTPAATLPGQPGIAAPPADPTHQPQPLLPGGQPPAPSQQVQPTGAETKQEPGVSAEELLKSRRSEQNITPDSGEPAPEQQNTKKPSTRTSPGKAGAPPPPRRF